VIHGQQERRLVPLTDSVQLRQSPVTAELSLSFETVRTLCSGFAQPHLYNTGRYILYEPFT
jgi:hypothetical protein